jgi:hypothetical protein
LRDEASRAEAEYMPGVETARVVVNLFSPESPLG